ncbi:MAG: phosphatase PAP2 family protein, partial [Acidimicrobiales bacterium]
MEMARQSPSAFRSRSLGVAACALVLFASWTAATRIGISHGSRESAWIIRPFGEWPSKLSVYATSDLQLSIVASYRAPATDATGSATAEIPALFGRASLGSVVDTFDSNNINGSRFTTGITAGPVASISVYVAAPIDAPPHNQYQLAIYDDAHGAPGRLVASTSSGTLAPDVWNTLPINATLEPKTPYWLMYNTNGTTGTVNNLTVTPVSGFPLDTLIRSHRSASLARRADNVTAVGGLVPMSIAVIALAVVGARRRRRAGVALLIGFAAALFFGWVVRTTLFAHFGDYPSGHALRVTYVAAAMAYVIPRRSVRLGGSLVVVLVSVASVYAGGHYSEEIIGGLLLGWAFAAGARAFAPNPAKRVAGAAPRGRPDVGVIDLRDTDFEPHEA